MESEIDDAEEIDAAAVYIQHVFTIGGVDGIYIISPPAQRVDICFLMLGAEGYVHEMCS